MPLAAKLAAVEQADEALREAEADLAAKSIDLGRHALLARASFLCHESRSRARVDESATIRGHGASLRLGRRAIRP